MQFWWYAENCGGLCRDMSLEVSGLNMYPKITLLIFWDIFGCPDENSWNYQYPGPTYFQICLSISGTSILRIQGLPTPTGFLSNGMEWGERQHSQTNICQITMLSSYPIAFGTQAIKIKSSPGCSMFPFPGAGDFFSTTGEPLAALVCLCVGLILLPVHLGRHLSCFVPEPVCTLF